MYDLPKDFDGSVLIGRTLKMVCYDQHQISLHFDSSITITIETAFSYRMDDINEIPLLGRNTTELIGCALAKVDRDPYRTLFLRFNNGITLKVLDTNKQYTSYRISHKGKVVFP